MKHVLLLSFLSMGIFSVNGVNPGEIKNTAIGHNYLPVGSNNASQQPDSQNMLATVFRRQEACRIELKDFEFNVEFKLVSCTVYFSGTNFRGVETGYLTSKSLTPIKSLITRCAPGTMVVFDNVKVLDPNNEIRTIQGTSYMLK